MKIEVGKIYKTRDGRKAFVGGCFANSPMPLAGEQVYVAHVEDITSFVTYDQSGSRLICEASPFDLISEWKEPVKVSGWVNVYPGNMYPYPTIFSSKEHADTWANKERIACVYISGEEGKTP